jgi:hypothetical protein
LFRLRDVPVTAEQLLQRRHVPGRGERVQLINTSAGGCRQRHLHANPATSTFNEPLPASTPDTGQAEFDSYIGPLQVDIALGIIQAVTPGRSTPTVLPAVDGILSP